MTDRELMQQALEALEWIFADTRFVDPKATMQALRERLARQEPQLVAVIGNWGRVEWVDGVFPQIGDKMYSAPQPAQQPLTDEQKENERLHRQNAVLLREKLKAEAEAKEWFAKYQALTAHGIKEQQ